MNASDIVRLLNTDHYAPADLDEVNNICRHYPEFGTAHMLKVRIMEVLGHEKDKALKVAAVYAMDRKKLYQLVNEVHETIEKKEEPEAPPSSGFTYEASGTIEFSDEPHAQADVIIEQHAPYAGQDRPDDLLELEEESREEVLEIVDKEEPVGDRAGIEAQTEVAEQQEDAGQAEEDANSNSNLIQSFIKEDPGVIRADSQTQLKGDVSLSSIKEHDGFITDTLAKIYVKQGLFARAIYAYEKLSLKYPEKSAYFAAQIEKIRNINHS